MYLSKNLTLGEVIKSQTALRNGIDNTPTIEHRNNLEILAREVFQPIRDRFKSPIYVSSGYRCKQLNDILRGSQTSHHLIGMAIDIDQDGRSNVTNRQVFNFIKDNLLFTQLIWEFGEHNPAWVHVSYDRHDLRREVLIAYIENGEVKYKNYET